MISGYSLQGVYPHPSRSRMGHPLSCYRNEKQVKGWATRRIHTPTIYNWMRVATTI